MAVLRQSDLIDLNKSFEEKTPEEILRWAKETFGKRIFALSSMQKAGNVICHMLSRLKLDIEVLFVDTGVLFPETYETRDRIVREYGLTIRTLIPRLTMAEQTREMGVLYLSVEGQKQCCHMRKVEPLLEIKDEFDALIGSLRRSDGGPRSVCPYVAIDEEAACVRINPLASFTNEQLKAYIREHDVILNPLHEQGYATVGCIRCTTPILPHEDRRAGRWRHLGAMAMYCGINPTDLDPYASPSIELPLELVDKILGREEDFAI